MSWPSAPVPALAQVRVQVQVQVRVLVLVQVRERGFPGLVGPRVGPVPAVMAPERGGWSRRSQIQSRCSREQ